MPGAPSRETLRDTLAVFQTPSAGVRAPTAQPASSSQSSSPPAMAPVWRDQMTGAGVRLSPSASAAVQAAAMPKWNEQVHFSTPWQQVPMPMAGAMSEVHGGAEEEFHFYSVGGEDELRVAPVFEMQEAPTAAPSLAAGLEEEEEEEGGQHTTLMLHNLPRGTTYESLRELLDALGFQNLYDHVYIPLSKRRPAQRNFAFVNFISAYVATNFKQLVHNRLTFPSGPVMIQVARVQGAAENAEHRQERQRAARNLIFRGGKGRFGGGDGGGGRGQGQGHWRQPPAPTSGYRYGSVRAPDAGAAVDDTHALVAYASAAHNRSRGGGSIAPVAASHDGTASGGGYGGRAFGIAAAAVDGGEPSRGRNRGRSGEPVAAVAIAAAPRGSFGKGGKHHVRADHRTAPAAAASQKGRGSPPL